MLSAQRLSLADAPDYLADNGFGGIELLDRQLSVVDDDALLALGRRCTARECGVIVDAGCDLTLSDPAAIEAELDHLRKVIDQAALLGCSVVRVALGGSRFSIQKLIRRARTPDPGRADEARSIMSSARVRQFGYLYRSHTSNFIGFDESRFDNTIQALDRILPYANGRGISLAIENHWGISSRPEWILRIVAGVSEPNIGTCPDFGNFPSLTDRYQGLAMLAPLALHVQAKCWSFGKGGEERTIDFGRCLEILGKSGYDRTVAVEYEGGGDEMEACIKARELILGNL